MKGACKGSKKDAQNSNIMQHLTPEKMKRVLEMMVQNKKESPSLR